MTFMGKILVVLNFVMSILFVAFAMIIYTTREDLRAKLDTAEDSLRSTQSELSGANQELDLKKDELQELQQNFDLTEERHRAENDAHAQEMASLRGDLDSFKERHMEKESISVVTTEEAATRTGEVDQLIKVRNDLLTRNSNLLTDNSALRDQLQQVSNERTTALERNGQLVEQVNKLLNYVAVVQDQFPLPGLDEIDPIVGEPMLPPPPKVEVVVNAVDPQSNFIEISLGSDSGLRQGHVLEVWRTEPLAEYVGQVRVVKTDATSSVAKPVSTVSIVRVNDRVGPETVPYQR